MSEVFERSFTVGWRDVDPNGHVANMVYLEYAVDTRIGFFASCGFPPSNFLKHGFGPVIKSDYTEYFREAAMLDELRVTRASATSATLKYPSGKRLGSVTFETFPRMLAGGGIDDQADAQGQAVRLSGVQADRA